VNKKKYNYDFTKDPLFIKKLKICGWWYTKNLVCQHQGWYFFKWQED
jgi:hypothetical protein